MRRVEELEEERHGPSGHHGLGLLAGSAGDVRQGPGSLAEDVKMLPSSMTHLKLKAGMIGGRQTAGLKTTNKNWEDPGLDQGVDWGVAIGGEQLTGSLELEIDF